MECGSNRSCPTCHVWVDDAFAALVGPPDEDEDDLIEMARAAVKHPTTTTEGDQPC